MRALVLLLGGCTPTLGGDPARVDSPRILAVWAEPPEARPGEVVTLQALVAGADGPTFAWCTEARAVAENRVASQGCLVGEAVASTPAAATVPADACALFGSEPPPAGPGEPPRRPADPDATGGYYQPVRATAAGAPPALGRVRVRCALPGAPAEVAVRFATEARPNQNPRVAAAEPVEAQEETQGEFTLAITLEAPETYLAYDVATATLSTRTEAHRATWYTDSGTLTGDLAGARWVPEGRPAQAWVVVRDDRGGVAVASWRLPE